MRNYTVYTDLGDYTNIYAWSAKEAERIVWDMTLGRATNIRAVPAGY